MAKPNQAARTKRLRERMKQEQAQEKRDKRAHRSEMRKHREAMLQDGRDPDLEGIVAGPQPPVTEP